MSARRSANESVLASQLAAALSPPSSTAAAAPHVEAQTPLIDGATSTSLRKLIGEERFDGLKDEFWEKWRAFSAALATARLDTARLATQAHDMVSLAGNLGYLRLAQACREVSHLAGGGSADLGPATRRMLAAADDTAREDRRG